MYCNVSANFKCYVKHVHVHDQQVAGFMRRRCVCSVSLCLSLSLSGRKRREDRRTCISPLTAHSQEDTASPQAEFSPHGVFTLALYPRVYLLKFCRSIMKVWGCVYWRCITDAHLAQSPAEHQHDGIGVSLLLHNGIIQTLFCALRCRTFLW